MRRWIAWTAVAGIALAVGGCFFERLCTSCVVILRVRSEAAPGAVDGVTVSGPMSSEAITCTLAEDETVCRGYPVGRYTLVVEAPEHDPFELAVDVPEASRVDCACPTIDEVVVLRRR